MIRDLVQQVPGVVASAACLTAPAWVPALVRWARHRMKCDLGQPK